MLTKEEQKEFLRIVRQMLKGQRTDLFNKKLTPYQRKCRHIDRRNSLVDFLKEVG